MDPFIIWLIGINILTFILFTIDFFIMVRNDYDWDKGLMDSRLLVLFAVAGGGVGMFAALFIWTGTSRGRRINKYNVAWWAESMLCILLWTLICAWRWGLVQLDLSHLFAGFDMFKLKVLGVYLLIMNAATFGAFCFDKTMAAEDKANKRIPEIRLLAMCFLGGSLGGIIAMQLIRHKTFKWYFAWGLPFFILVHIALLAYAHAAGLI